MSTSNRPETLGALIFDLDGTLADTLPVVVEAFQKTFVDFGLPVLSQSEIFSHFGPTEDGVVRAMFGDVSARAVSVFYENYRQLLAVGVSPFSNMRSLLRASHGVASRSRSSRKIELIEQEYGRRTEINFR